MCVQCREFKELTMFRSRSGKKAGSNRRRGTCSSCRQRARELDAPPEATAAKTESKPKRRRRSKGKELPAPLTAAIQASVTPNANGTQPEDASGLKPTRQGFIRMRGKTDNGRRWYQEVEPELAITLVRERAAVIVNRHTIRRIYSNKEFRRFILIRDDFTCHFCGQYGDTIDHLLPRAKGGHTTPDNCVCACNECNQSKADRDFGEYMRTLDPLK